ncbi:TadE/TadG family type IV pilus assembly protein [Methylocystis sp. Sn-Cys]|uniref:TadE/TadG family type IV pilus assembly protein n=1 Tax=Methylocystis sp. Sn-Cys TaxID=1701263 RepID=UPI00192307FE|nr:TadE/TadG family type IV pilus assembly protein [Methylocystis sp. Sn-Cys]MBL1258302.1 pilus assembly protein [Methylocystis sp. Sn-Cys]
MAKRLNRRFLDNRLGVVAVEFAFIGPALFLVLFGIICFGLVFGVYNSVQQLAAESARASVSGLSATERDQLAKSYVTKNVGVYGMLDPQKLSVATNSQGGTFRVTLTYDMSASLAFKLYNVLASASPTITRSAAVQNGGY